MSHVPVGNKARNKRSRSSGAGGKDTGYKSKRVRSEKRRTKSPIDRTSPLINTTDLVLKKSKRKVEKEKEDNEALFADDSSLSSSDEKKFYRCQSPETNLEYVESPKQGSSRTGAPEQLWKVDSFTKELLQVSSSTSVDTATGGKQPAIPTSFLSNVLGLNVASTANETCSPAIRPLGLSYKNTKETKGEHSSLLDTSPPLIDTSITFSPTTSHQEEKKNPAMYLAERLSLWSSFQASLTSPTALALALSQPGASATDAATAIAQQSAAALKLEQCLALAAMITRLPSLGLATASKPLQQPERPSFDSSSLVNRGQEKLLSHSDKLSAQDADGDTPLHILIAKDETAACKTLISVLNNNALNIKNEMKQTPLHIATYVGNQPVACALVSRGVSIATVDGNGDTPLHLACEVGDDSLVRSLLWLSYPTGSVGLLEALGIRNYQGKAPIHIAIEQKKAEVVKMLVTAGCDMNVQELTAGKTPLMIAIENGLSNVSEHLIRAGAAVNKASYNENIALHSACQYNNAEIADLLIDKGSNICVKNVEAMTPKDLTRNSKIKNMLDKEMVRLRRKRHNKKD